MYTIARPMGGSDDEKRMLWSSWPDAIPSVHLQLSSLIPPPVVSPDFPDDVDWKRQEDRLVPFQVLQWMRYYQGICYYLVDVRRHHLYHQHY